MNFYNDMQRVAYTYPLLSADQLNDMRYYDIAMRGETFALTACLAISRLFDTMNGRPAWMGSFTLRSTANIAIPVKEWEEVTLNAAQRQFETQLLKGVGDQRVEMLFRRHTTILYQRACTDEEIRGLPEWFMNAKPTDFFSGPLENMWVRGIPKEWPTIQPCEKPTKKYTDMTLTTHYFDDCMKKCRPCKARLALQVFIQGLPWPLPEYQLYKRVKNYNERLAKVQDIMLVEV